MSRSLFSDGWNSFSHVGFGFFSGENPWIMPAFFFYQLAKRNPDTEIDILEFMAGFFLNKITSYLIKKREMEVLIY